MASHITLEDAVDRLGPVPQDIRRAMELIKDLDKQARPGARLRTPTSTGSSDVVFITALPRGLPPPRRCSGLTSSPR
jgi:hypothetical protein